MWLTGRIVAAIHLPMNQKGHVIESNKKFGDSGAEVTAEKTLGPGPNAAGRSK